jgi:hypothetical protein
MSYSNFGLINSSGFNRRRESGEKTGFYTPTETDNVASFFISSDLTKNTASDGRVSAVAPTIGSGELTQSNADYKPNNSLSTLNGYKLWDFNGSNYKFNSDLDFNVRSSAGENPNKTMLILAKIDSGASSNRVLMGQWGSGANLQNRLRISPSGGSNISYQVNTASGNFAASGTKTTTAFCAYWIIFNKASGTPNALFFNREQFSVGSVAISDSVDPVNLVLGSNNNDDTSESFHGQIAQVCIWEDLVMNWTQRQAELGALNAFWGLSL